MSLIAKRRAKKLAKPHRLLTSTSTAELLDIVEAVAKSFPVSTKLLSKQSQFYAFDRTASGCGIAYGKPSDKRDTGRVHFWTGSVEIVEGAGAEERIVTIQLVGWRTLNDDILNRKEFVAFRERLVERMTAADPGLTVLDAD